MSEKFLYDPKEPLWIAGNKPISEPFLNQFYQTINVAQLHRLEKLARSLKSEIETIGMTPQQFMSQVNAAYQRYQQHRGLDAFQPMDEKSMKYVLEFMEESIKEVAKEVAKNTAKNLIR
ncbi:MAG: hypothetical protein N2Z22_03305 [Turneriella sp.]|nr:hypothetical protein [Turneriella sp.]